MSYNCMCDILFPSIRLKSLIVFFKESPLRFILSSSCTYFTDSLMNIVAFYKIKTIKSHDFLIKREIQIASGGLLW